MKNHNWFAWLLIASGLAMTVFGIGHRLPYNSDEASVVDHALRLFMEGPNPRWFHYPSLHLYAVALLQGILFAGMWLLGSSPTPEAFASAYFSDPRAVLVASRLWSLVAGVGTLTMVYRIGARLR